MKFESRSFNQVSFLLLTIGLIGHPLCILVYWCLNPAYGQFDPTSILNSLTGHSTIMTTANAFALASCILAIPATLAAMVAIGDHSPKLVLTGGALVIVGWMAIFGILVLDVVAIQMVASGQPSNEFVDLFSRITNCSTLSALNALASFHLIGGLLIGIAFWNTRLVPRWAAMILIAGGPIHFGSNIAGMLLVDAMTWIALVAANIPVIRILKSLTNFDVSNGFRKVGE